MAQVIFLYKGNEISIQCKITEQFKDIFNKFSSKMNIDLNKLVFLYGGSKLNENLTFENQSINKDIINNTTKITVCEIDKYNNNEYWENIDINKQKKELKIILCKYLDDRVYLGNKVDNWKEAILKESEKIFLIYKEYKIFMHLSISEKLIQENNFFNNSGLFHMVDLHCNVGFESKNIKADLDIIIFKKNRKRTKKDLSNVMTLIETEFLNLAEGREYKIFMEKYYKMFEDKFKEILDGYNYSLYYYIETFNNSYKGTKGFKFINKDKDDYVLSKLIDSGDIKLYVNFGKAN